MPAMTFGERLRRGIEEDILAGLLAPGDVLDERALAERYSISRTPVREALLQLSTMGLVSMRPRMPTRVATIDAATVLQMTEVMSCLEAQAARLAARRMSPAQREHLRRIQGDAQAVVAAADSAGFNEANWKLHLAIFAGSQNAYLASQARHLRLRLHPYRCLLVRLGGRMEAAHVQHDRLVKAIVDGDGDEAFDAMRHHLTLDSDQFADLVSLMPRSVGDEEDADADSALTP